VNGYYHPLTGKWTQEGDAGYNADYAAQLQQAATDPNYDPNTAASYTMLQGGQDYIGGDVGRAQGGMIRNDPAGTQPFFGFGGGGSTFVSSDPNEIDRYQHNARTRSLQGAAKVGALVGGAAALGGTQWGGGGAATPTSGYTGSATVSGTNAATGAVAPTTAAGLPTGPASAAGGGVGTMSGSVPSVGASPGLSGGGMSFLDRMQQFSRIPSGGGGGYQQPQQPQGRRFQNATPMITVTPREQLMASRLMRRY